MSETEGVYIIIALATIAGALIVLYYGKPEPEQQRVAETQPQYTVYTDAGVIFLQTDDPQEAEQARAWVKGKVATWA